LELFCNKKSEVYYLVSKKDGSFVSRNVISNTNDFEDAFLSTDLGEIYTLGSMKSAISDSGEYLYHIMMFSNSVEIDPFVERDNQ